MQVIDAAKGAGADALAQGAAPVLLVGPPDGS
jgi:hypothetical protein